MLTNKKNGAPIHADETTPLLKKEPVKKASESSPWVFKRFSSGGTLVGYKNITFFMGKKGSFLNANYHILNERDKCNKPR